MAPENVDVNVRLDRDRPQREIVDDLTAVGLHVDRVLRRLSVVSGNVAPENLPALCRVKGVRAVELDRPVTFAPG